jgi:hypothetical protein
VFSVYLLETAKIVEESIGVARRILNKQSLKFPGKGASKKERDATKKKVHEYERKLAMSARSENGKEGLRLWRWVMQAT